MADTFIYNYASSGGRRHTVQEEMERQTVARVDPEVLRRVFAMMTDALHKKVDIGIGGGWRPGSDQLDSNGNVKPGFAPPGNSNHQSFPWESNAPNAVALDMIGDLNWIGANAGRFGLRDFSHVNNEPWHVQPAEIPGSRMWREEPWNLRRISLPGQTFDPAHGVWGFMPRRKKPTIIPGSPRSRTVSYAQGVMKLRVANFAHWFGAEAESRAKNAVNPKRKRRLNIASEKMFEAQKLCETITVDGHFGPKTANAVVAMEDAFEGRKLNNRILRFDEKSTIGGNTWFFLDNLSDSIW